MNCPQCHTRPVPEIGGAPVLCPQCMRRCYATIHGPDAKPAPGTADRTLWDLADSYRFELGQRVLIVKAEAFGTVIARWANHCDHCGPATYSVQYEHGSQPTYVWTEHELEAAS